MPNDSQIDASDYENELNRMIIKVYDMMESRSILISDVETFNVVLKSLKDLMEWERILGLFRQFDGILIYNGYVTTLLIRLLTL
jgi:hypothetical protein